MSFIRLYSETVPTAIGLFLIALSTRNYWRGRATRRWTSAPGRITRSFVLVTPNDESGFGYTPQVEYEYTVEGTPYRGTLLQSGQIGSQNRARAEKVIVPFPAGASVTVFYNPARPANAVLVRGTSWGNLFISAAGLAFLACGIFFMTEKTK